MNRSITLHNNTSDLPRLMGFIEGLNIDDSMLMPMQLALEEVFVNIASYAYPHDVVGDILIDVEQNKEAIIFIVKDHGIPFNPTNIPDADISLSAESRDIGGLGIYIVRQIMDKISYRRAGNQNILKLTKYTNR